LKLKAPDGKLRATDCVNTKSTFKMIQPIPSKKAEPFKQWLAQVGKDRIDEIENHELTKSRMKDIYKKKGYSDDWIEKIVRGIIIKNDNRM
jgi:DNA-damage-inducible protein D